jgi:hypothetical protein
VEAIWKQRSERLVRTDNNDVAAKAAGFGGWADYHKGTPESVAKNGRWRGAALVRAFSP